MPPTTTEKTLNELRVEAIRGLFKDTLPKAILNVEDSLTGLDSPEELGASMAALHEVVQSISVLSEPISQATF